MEVGIKEVLKALNGGEAWPNDIHVSFEEKTGRDVSKVDGVAAPAEIEITGFQRRDGNPEAYELLGNVFKKSGYDIFGLGGRGVGDALKKHPGLLGIEIDSGGATLVLRGTAFAEMNKAMNEILFKPHIHKEAGTRFMPTFLQEYYGGSGPDSERQGR